MPQFRFPNQRAQNSGVGTFQSKLEQPNVKKTSSAIRLSLPAPRVAPMVESIVGCKWSLTVLQLVQQGVNRPGLMERAVPGLTAKVLNERLRKMVRFGILDRIVFPELPLRVEYRLTSFGKKFVAVLRTIEKLESDLAGG